jgi:hypothetical protein
VASGGNATADDVIVIHGCRHDAAVEEDALEERTVEVPCKEEFTVVTAPVLGRLDCHHTRGNVEAEAGGWIESVFSVSIRGWDLWQGIGSESV